jgi:hypothetical protein
MRKNGNEELAQKVNKGRRKKDENNKNTTKKLATIQLIKKSLFY